MSDKITLLPCPFCMSKAKFSDYINPYQVHCTNEECVMGGGNFYTSNEAVKGWNLRARRELTYKHTQLCTQCAGMGYTRVPECDVCGKPATVEGEDACYCDEHSDLEDE